MKSWQEALPNAIISGGRASALSPSAIFRASLYERMAPRDRPRTAVAALLAARQHADRDH